MESARTNNLDHLRNVSTGDKKSMLHGLELNLNMPVKHYNLDNLFIYKTKNLYT